MLKGQILDQILEIVELKGEEKLSYSRNFEAYIVTNQPILDPLGTKITVEQWSGYIISWKFIYIDPHQKYHYICTFCSKFEFLHTDTRFDIYENLSVKDIVTAILPDCEWRVSPTIINPYLIQYEESDLNLIRYLSYINGFSYLERDERMLFANSPYLFTKNVKLKYSNIRQSDPDVVNYWGFELKKAYPVGQVYSFNILNPNEKLYAAKPNNNSQEYWSEVNNSIECLERANRELDDQMIYVTETRNPNLKTGDSITLTDHPMAGEYYIIYISHSYKVEYKNICHMLTKDRSYLTPKTNLNMPKNLQVATVESVEGTNAKFRFQWSRKLMSAPVVTSTAGKDYGALIMPKSGERIIVGFMDASKPLIIGSVYDGLCATPESGYIFKDANNFQASIRLNKLEISAQDDNQIILNNSHSQIEVTQEKVVLRASQIEIETNMLNLKSEKFNVITEIFNIKSNQINIEANSTHLSTNEQLLLKAGSICMRAIMNAELTSPFINFITG